jgi:tetratricopeptide (TPR) repeat protein
MGNLAELEFMCGFTERALELLDRAGEMFEELNATSRLATARVNSAAYRLTLGKIDQAYADAIDALSLAQRAQDSPLISIALQHVATVLALEGESKRSAIIMGYVDNWFEHEGYRREPCEQQLYDILRSSLTSHLSQSEIERFAALGITLSEARALDLACAS